MNEYEIFTTDFTRDESHDKFLFSIVVDCWSFGLVLFNLMPFIFPSGDDMNIDTNQIIRKSDFIEKKNGPYKKYTFDYMIKLLREFVLFGGTATAFEKHKGIVNGLIAVAKRDYLRPVISQYPELAEKLEMEE